jgi:hypothetical protein
MDDLLEPLSGTAVDIEVSPFHHVGQIIKYTRIYRSMKEGAEPEISVRPFGASIGYGDKIAAQIGRIIRGHWSVENINHSKRDAPVLAKDHQ